jgi:hypothetical protein
VSFEHVEVTTECLSKDTWNGCQIICDNPWSFRQRGLWSHTLTKMLRRFFYLSLGMLLLAGARWATVPRASGAFTDLVPLTVPQRAAADFDADGRTDVAFIQEAQGGSRVWVTLSGSPDAVTFETNAVSIVANDIDHDGDVDLVATTSSNQVVIWINDGRGHFTQEQERLPSSDLSLATMVVDSSRDQPVASGPAAPQFAVHSRRNEAGVVATRIRPPTAPRGVTPSFLSLSSPRAPPFASNLN